jgi:hypothetical protein
MRVAFRFGPEFPDQSRPALPFRPPLLRKTAALLWIGTHARWQPTTPELTRQQWVGRGARIEAGDRRPHQTAGSFGCQSLLLSGADWQCDAATGAFW